MHANEWAQDVKSIVVQSYKVTKAKKLERIYITVSS